jgi:hypothetical protein
MAKCVLNISKYRYNFKSKNKCLQNFTCVSANIYSSKHEAVRDKYVILTWKLLFEFKSEIHLFHELKFSDFYDLFKIIISLSTFWKHTCRLPKSAPLHFIPMSGFHLSLTAKARLLPWEHVSRLYPFLLASCTPSFPTELQACDNGSVREWFI